MTRKEFRESLVVSLVAVYVAECEGIPNPLYGAKLLIFFFSVCAGGSKVSFEFLSGNLCAVSLRHMKVLCERRRMKPFIDLDQNDIVTPLCDHMVEIRKRRSDPDSRVAFTAGFGGTVIVKKYPVYHSCGVVVGCEYPNHYLPFDMTATSERGTVERGEDI